MRLGPWEIALIAMLVVVLFGARKIPEIMRGLGLGIKEFKSSVRDEDQEGGKKTGKENGESKVESKKDKDKQ